MHKCSLLTRESTITSLNKYKADLIGSVLETTFTQRDLHQSSKYSIVEILTARGSLLN